MNQLTGKDLITQAVLPRFFFALLLSFAGTLFASLFIPPGVAQLIGIVPLIVLIALLVKMLFSKNKSGKLTTYGMRLPMWLVYLFVILMGIGMFPALGYYIGSMGMTMVVVAFGITTALFGGLFLYTYFTKRDFTFLGGMLFFALLGIILFGIVGFFVQSDILHLGIAFVTVLVFSGYMLYDISRMKSEHFTREDVPSAVFDLYLNYINLLLSILRILNYFRR